jgi:hypothetical protein
MLPADDSGIALSWLCPEPTLSCPGAVLAFPTLSADDTSQASEEPLWSSISCHADVLFEVGRRCAGVVRSPLQTNLREIISERCSVHIVELTWMVLTG